MSGAGGAGASGASGAGGTPSFPAVLTGTWLVGWSGGLNHYSWLHFTPSTGGFDGELRVLSGQSLSVNAPLWNCDGVGSWTVTAKPMTVLLTFPAGCATAAESLTWTSFDAATFPMGANLHASIEAALTTGSPLEGFRFDDSQCDAAFTSCADPFPF